MCQLVEVGFQLPPLGVPSELVVISTACVQRAEVLLDWGFLTGPREFQPVRVCEEARFEPLHVLPLLFFVLRRVVKIRRKLLCFFIDRDLVGGEEIHHRRLDSRIELGEEVTLEVVHWQCRNYLPIDGQEEEIDLRVISRKLHSLEVDRARYQEKQ